MRSVSAWKGGSRSRSASYRCVSGKRLCSGCSNPLGRGAAMIIDTLGLFFHMQCFKVCVKPLRPFIIITTHIPEAKTLLHRISRWENIHMHHNTH
ncbi:hypothetical protein GOODEAATRI_013068 [Goodea atripinnis]|uniref:LIM zinc-binding domain-containing protein n=1 Tax=Goodea atripinnis TaxID=208336 RepID=A0ABV0NAC9_9TELE